MGIVVGALILGWFLGYASAKWKSLLATLKKSADQAKKDRALSAAKAKMESAGAGEDEAEQEEDEEKKAKEEAQEVLEEFLSRDAAPGLDDHPDSFVNPIIMLQIKLAKEEVRRRKALDALIKAQEYDEGYWESLSPEEQAAIERKLLESTTGVPVARQKLSCPKAWKGMLADDAAFDAKKIKPKLPIMLMGTAELTAPPPGQ